MGFVQGSVLSPRVEFGGIWKHAWEQGSDGRDHDRSDYEGHDLIERTL